MTKILTTFRDMGSSVKEQACLRHFCNIFNPHHIFLTHIISHAKISLRKWIVTRCCTTFSNKIWHHLHIIWYPSWEKASNWILKLTLLLCSTFNVVDNNIPCLQQGNRNRRNRVEVRFLKENLYCFAISSKTLPLLLIILLALPFFLERDRTWLSLLELART